MGDRNQKPAKSQLVLHAEEVADNKNETYTTEVVNHKARHAIPENPKDVCDNKMHDFRRRFQIDVLEGYHRSPVPMHLPGTNRSRNIYKSGQIDKGYCPMEQRRHTVARCDRSKSSFVSTSQPRTIPIKVRVYEHTANSKQHEKFKSAMKIESRLISPQQIHIIVANLHSTY